MSNQKSNHKHQYIDVLVLSKSLPRIANKCTVCGKLKTKEAFIRVQSPNSRFSRLITSDDEAKSMYPNLEVIYE